MLECVTRSYPPGVGAENPGFPADEARRAEAWSIMSEQPETFFSLSSRGRQVYIFQVMNNVISHSLDTLSRDRGGGVSPPRSISIKWLLEMSKEHWTQNCAHHYNTPYVVYFKEFRLAIMMNF